MSLPERCRTVAEIEHRHLADEIAGSYGSDQFAIAWLMLMYWRRPHVFDRTERRSLAP